MKPGGPDHPKTHELAMLLGIPPIFAAGVLECLWQWAAKYAPCGDIGRWPDAAIATRIGWPGDAEKLIESLVAARFVERHESHRLVIHDWHEHATDAVHMAIARAGKVFWCGQKPKTNRLSKKERERIDGAYARHTHGIRTQNAQETHGVRFQNAPPSPPLPSPPIPPPPSATAAARAVRQKPEAVAAAGSVVWEGDQERAYERLRIKPNWLADGEPWIDAVTCRKLARLPTTSLALIDWWLSEARANRKKLKAPAGFVIKNIREPDPDLLKALAIQAQAATELATGASQ